MAVIAVWKCDRDGTMFEDKKSAEMHDKMLELAANISYLIEKEITGISEQNLEQIGMLLAKRSDDLVKACKGKPEVLLKQAPQVKESDEQPDNVTAIAN
ncbi:hypothetical protein SAMN02745866_03325 [Alteromonadaceae bacterium Bs31]|nr:hypothetical protein SAMN02745866_03325 [Alteromonadaceae bacterium Bs31]